jgi:hypothetical protein
MTSAVVMSTA